MQEKDVSLDMEDDDAVRMAFRNPWGELFIHAYRADGLESNSERERKMDVLLSKIFRDVDAEAF